MLYETGRLGAYHALFSSSTNAYKVWRAVQLLRAVRSTMDEVKEEVEGRATQIATQGDLLISHIVSRRLGQAVFHDIDHPWEPESLATVAPLSRTIVLRLIARIDSLFQRTPIQSLFKSRERTSQLVDELLHDLDQDVQEPQLASKYRATRTEQRFNAVAIIVDGGMIDDGTVLEFRPGTGSQRRLFAPWLAQDPRRGRAAWVNDRAKPLIWEIDRTQYSADSLIRHMTSLLTNKPSSAGQGTRRWYIPGQGCLADIASASFAFDDDAD